MPTNVDLKLDGDTAVAATAQVYVRRLWSQDWIAMPYLYPNELAWAVAPSTSSATFSWRYGNILQAGATVAAETPRLDVAGWFIKVVITDPADAEKTLTWYGVIEDPHDELGGVGYGRQRLTAFGMEIMLERHVITSSIALDHELLAEQTISRGLTFNHDNTKNRTEQRNGPVARHRFFGGEDAEHWSTRDIVESLLVDQTPRDPAGEEILKWRILADDRDLLPEWDQPVVSTHGRTTREVLNELLDRRIMLSYWVEVWEDPEDEDADPEIRIRVFTYIDEELEVDADEGYILAANPNVRTIDFDDTQSAAGAAITSSTVHKADQVIVQGARRRNCFSVSFQDGTLDKAWESSLETEYRTAASGAGDYPTKANERVRRNRDARSNDKFDSVYSRYKLPDDWDFQVSDGIGGDKVSVAPEVTDLQDVPEFYRPELYLLPTIPLLEGHRYDGSRIAGETVEIVAEAVEYRELVPLVVAELPEDPDRWVQLDRWGEVADLAMTDEEKFGRSWTAHVEVEPNSLRLQIVVQGGPRHALGLNHFTAIDSSDDEEENAAVVDWEDLIATVAMADDRFCEVRYPATDDLDPLLETIRTVRLDVGDEFRLDYVASTTVVGVDPTNGSLQRTTGGGYIRDDRPALKRIARLAFEWYRKTRAVLRFGVSSIVARDELWLGDFITTVGGDEIEINSTITEIRLRFGVAQGASAPPPHRQEFTTGYGELDVTRFI